MGEGSEDRFIWTILYFLAALQECFLCSLILLPSYTKELF